MTPNSQPLLVTSFGIGWSLNTGTGYVDLFFGNDPRRYRHDINDPATFAAVKAILEETPAFFRPSDRTLFTGKEPTGP